MTPVLLEPFTFEGKTPLHANIYATAISGLFVAKHTVFPDHRGLYRELNIIPDFAPVIGHEFVVRQTNHSRSFAKVARGFHTENWNKLVSVLAGVCWCVIADVRPDSPTFGRSQLVVLGDEPQGLYASIYISAGLANSVCAISGTVEYLYYVDALYRDRDVAGDKALSLFDPDLAIQWPFPKEELVISQRDLDSVTLRQRFPERFA